MTIDTSADVQNISPEDEPEWVRRERQPLWRRAHAGTGLVLGVIGYFVGHWLGNAIGHNYQQVVASDENNLAIILGYAIGTIGFLAGLGILNYPLAKMVGREPVPTHERQSGVGRYFAYTLDHKVVGVQYLFAMIFYFLVAGLFALGIRTELLSPTRHVFPPGVYLTIVGEHGTLMMMMMTSAILGPFGNYLVPLMIGARRMAYPRLEALSFWLTVPAFVILLSGFFLGGFPTGWTGYAPLSVQATLGMDAYLFAFGLMGTSMIVGGFNLIATIFNYRAPGMLWSRLPIFVWSMLITSYLMVLAAPVLVVSLYFAVMDRTMQTALFVPQHGGSSYLWENLFWFFGHPEVYILALPGFGIVAELLPVFARKPLFGYRTMVAGMIGVGSLSFFVWQHHLFVSGMNPDMRPVIMLTTELISVPTGIVYLAAVGTLWRAKLRLEVPMLFVLGMYFNFLIGGISGVFLSDVPADGVAHGSFFVMAHFHYTIMGGYMFAFFAGVYYFAPKMTGRRLSERLGKWQFWLMFLGFNSTFLPLFAVGQLGMPRRVFEYAQRLQSLNDWVSISAYVLGTGVLVFVINLAYSLVVNPVAATGNVWHSRGLEWMVASPPPVDNFVRTPTVVSGPYEYGVPDAPPMATIGGRRTVPATAEG